MVELIIIAITCLVMILAIVFLPSFKLGKLTISSYWVVSLLGALTLIMLGSISFTSIKDGLFSNSTINPVKILVLFFSMTFISIYLDEIGFFKYVANLVLKRAKTGQIKLFLYLFLIVSVLTIFTSNDIIILTFTPFVCYFSKNAKINPLPFLFCEFVAANTWSMLLIIGNPTNIYLGTAANIGFLEYFLIMIVPTIFAGASAFIVLYLIFRKKLTVKISQPVIEDYKTNDKFLLITGLVHLILCTLFLVFSSYIHLEMWLITLLFALSLCAFVFIRRTAKKQSMTDLTTSFKRLPYELMPFILSMFVIVLCLKEIGFTVEVGRLLNNGNPIFTYGITSFLSSNLINNIPMSIIFEVIALNVSSTSYKGAIYASIIGSNLGALLTPIGALAGIMWMNTLKNYKIKISFLTFIKYGALIGIISLSCALLGLYLVV